MGVVCGPAGKREGGRTRVGRWSRLLATQLDTDRWCKPSRFIARCQEVATTVNDAVSKAVLLIIMSLPHHQGPPPHELTAWDGFFF